VTDRSERRFRVALVVLALGAVALRLLVIGLWAGEQPVEGDQAFYHHQAQDLADWVGFTYRHPAGERITTAAHPPLHTSLLGVASLLGADSVGAHRLVGAVLGGVTALLAGLCGRRLCGASLPVGRGGRARGGLSASASRRAGLVAAAAVAVAPTLWINDTGILSESSYAAAIALVLFAAVDVLARPTLVGLAALGAAVGLATLTRAEALTLVALLVVPVAFVVAGRLGTAGPRRLVPVMLALVAVGVVTGPWFARNLVSFERPVLTSSGPGWVLEIANCDATYYGDRLGYWDVSCDRTPWQAGDETATEVVKREVGLTYATDNASRLPVVVAARVARMWDLWRPAESVRFNEFYERRGGATSAAALGVWWVLLAGALVGAYQLRRRALLLWPFAAVAISTTFAAAASFGITRYRTGLEVAAAVLASVAVAAWFDARARRVQANDDESPLVTATDEESM
jgi:hypothetical protein